MAKLTKNETKPVIPPPTYTLELDEDEAALIQALVGSLIGGGKYRKASDRVFAAFYGRFGLTSNSLPVGIAEGARLSG